MKKAMVIPLAAAMFVCGCTAVYTPKLSAISWGLDSTQALSGLNVTRWSTADTNDYYEIILDQSTGSQSSGKLIDGLIAVGEVVARAKGVPAGGAATDDSSVAVPRTQPAAETVYVADGYDGEPGPGGEGVYGTSACLRCRNYKAAHPDVEIIDTADKSNLADMWAALKLRGFTGNSVGLPVVVTESGYTERAQ
jgi:hypothetical protein